MCFQQELSLEGNNVNNINAGFEEQDFLRKTFNPDETQAFNHPRDISFASYIRDLYRAGDETALQNMLPYYDNTRHNFIKRVLDNEIEEEQKQGIIKVKPTGRLYQRKQAKRKKQMLYDDEEEKSHTSVWKREAVRDQDEEQVTIPINEIESMSNFRSEATNEEQMASLTKLKQLNQMRGRMKRRKALDSSNIVNLEILSELVAKET